MKLKKWSALALALTLALSLTACGNGGTGGQTTPTPNQSGAAGTPAPTPTQAADDDWSYVQGQGKLKIGYTVFEPMNYTDDNGEFVGFETEFGKAVCEKLGVEPEFVEISWDAKVMELETKNIDCIWNGMTITPELSEALAISQPYIKNYQVIVIRAADADLYQTTADLVGKNLEAEASSAGEATIVGEDADANLAQGNYTSVGKQTDALLEVKTGAADAAVMDFVLADAIVGQGDYSDLMVIPDLQLSVEEYGIGFRKGSTVTEQVNAAIDALIADGTLNAIAEKYELSELLLANQ